MSIDSNLSGSALEKRLDDLNDETSESENLLDVMVPFADMMALLLVFFVFFYVITDFEKNKRIVEQNQMIIEQNEKLTVLAMLDPMLDLSEQFITIPVEAVFNERDALLKWEALRTLAQVARNIQNRINDEPGWQIRIEGHTDDVPIISGNYASNWELSTARALNVVKFFMDNNFFPPEQMQAMGYGEFKPLVPNDSEESRGKNRRIEIRLIKSLVRE